jgi:mono/diheme cytochrome c family protein/glucose/arabinose dehydrogenase
MNSLASSISLSLLVLVSTHAFAAEAGKSPDSKKKSATKQAAPPEPKAPEPAKAAAETPAPDVDPAASKPAVAVLSSDPAIAAAQSAKRAGGGPDTPELHFRPPAPRVLTAQEELKTLKVAPGFKVQLVASEPMIESPVAISWDDQGRMYVCEMRNYMHDVDGGGEDEQTGRISRLEDTDGDGVMDKSTVFVDKLLMPRAVMALGDGVLVAEPPLLVWYHDTDGDGVADKKEIVSEKYATKGGQPEHMANSPTWMMDNWISSSNHNVRYRLQQGKFLSEEFIGSGQWGRTQDDWGRQYANSNSDLLRADLFPTAYYSRNPRLPDRTGVGFQVMKDQTCWPSGPTPGVNRGYLEDSKKPDGTPVKGTLRPNGSLQSVTATCGPAIYRGDLFPAEYRGNAFIPEPSGNLVKRLILAEKDGVVTAKNAYEGKEFLTSTDERFRPVNAYTGPDGALYIVDMARGVIQHKGFLTYYLVANIKDRKLETPFNLGRIYRIVPDGAKPKAVKLPAETEKIVPLLAHANGWVRDTAQRVLVERGDAAVAPAVARLATTAKTPQAKVQALWTLEGLNAVKPEAITAALKDPKEKVRVAAVRLASEAQTPELLALVDDPSAEVRLELAFKLSGKPGPEVEKALVTLLEKANSPLFAEAVVSGLPGQELDFLTKLLKDTADNDEKLAASGIFGTLAGAVMKERKGPKIAQLIELAAAQPPESNRQIAMLNGMSIKGQKAPAKGSAPNLIKLESAPTGLDVLKKLPKAKLLAGRIDRQLTWAGKPGAVEVKVVPLTPDQQALFAKGKVTYTTLCGVCHQPTGAGMPGLAPPLLNSEWALGPTDRPIRIVLGGLTGPVEVGGTKWQLEMPGLPILSDEDIAGVLTYIRREWEHSESAVSPQEVASIRTATKSRAKPWTAEELQRPFNLTTVKAK